MLTLFGKQELSSGFDIIINPRRACAARVTVLGSVCVCVCVSVCIHKKVSVL